VAVVDRRAAPAVVVAVRVVAVRRTVAEELTKLESDS